MPLIWGLERFKTIPQKKGIYVYGKKRNMPEGVSIYQGSCSLGSLCDALVFLTYETEFALFIAVLKLCLSHGLRQLTRDVNIDIRARLFKTNDVVS